MWAPGFEKQFSGWALHSFNTIELVMGKIHMTEQRYHHNFSNPAAYIAHNAT